MTPQKWFAEQMVWMKFNMLTVLGKPKIEGSYHKKVSCICDCWTIRDFEIWRLTRWKIESCSCKQYQDMKTTGDTTNTQNDC
jgi:hypothetical protein